MLGDAIYEWQEAEKGKKKPKYEFTIPGQHPFGMAGLWKLWKNPKTNHWEKTFAVLDDEGSACGCDADQQSASESLRQPMNKTPKQSAGLLMFRRRSTKLEVFLVHPGGPYWSKKDQGAWTLPKGEFEAGEEPLAPRAACPNLA